MRWLCLAIALLGCGGRTDLPLPARERGAATARLKGTVSFEEGDFFCCPSHGRSYPVARRIVVHDAVKRSELTPDMRGGMLYREVPTELVAETTSAEDGTFDLAVPPGEYSVFTEEPIGAYYAGGWDSRNDVAGYVNVKDGETANHNVTITWAAVY